MEEKEDKTNKTEMLNKFTIYTKENINSEISSLFYGITKLKKNCSQCKNGFYSFSHLIFQKKLLKNIYFIILIKY